MSESNKAQGIGLYLYGINTKVVKLRAIFGNKVVRKVQEDKI